jgi:hypothetical protein
MPRRSFLSVVERENLIALPAFHSCSFGYILLRWLYYMPSQPRTRLSDGQQTAC